ncbi:sigma-70 family RNA polymerase sigma factor [candidate division KSB1 bacterium]|nr:sigma-70 family RNA polymerase sigma factor [candidate division KSB1 bacterium]NIR68581.1 sigma-70 family RNA polymerase sigma factor [candidate division KSB1 bacterium]NIS25418.1 sigma-70 family RNA polymerase sigma factor [candidate division KSB1 bacterium]NIT72310.1 sigma-70 family RNA polymerase sigma factor [candidate division KSB1 bacterium]NIU26094.1 sigma-70 family RNA polymerase sigma factor [candidate division KSB1 bacterium]
MQNTEEKAIASFDEKEIILKCQRGDKQAFGLLVKKYMRRAYFCALAFVATHEAALDLSQEAFVRVYKAMKRFDTNRKFFTWYYRILKNLCLNYLRDRTRHARPFSEIGEAVVQALPDDGSTALDHLEQAEIRENVWKCLNSLKSHEKEIIILKDFQDVSYKEIAEMLDCPIGTVMSRLYNARKALRTELERYVS